jgi:hypothetical protein
MAIDGCDDGLLVTDSRCHDAPSRTVARIGFMVDLAGFGQVRCMIVDRTGQKQEIEMHDSPLNFSINGSHLRWMDDGACNGVGDWNTLFFGDERAKRRGLPAEVPSEAERFCLACDVRVECLSWALDNDEDGVWGGTTRQQREAMSRPIVRAKCPACQGRSLFRAGLQQVCGDCGSSWEATKIHGNAHAPVDVTTPGRTGNVILLPVRWTFEQPPLFDTARYVVARTPRKRGPRTCKVCRDEQLRIPGIDGKVTRLRRQARTKPVTPRFAAA